MARSTLAAETLAMSEACDAASHISNLNTELLNPINPQPVSVFTDNQSLFESIQTTKPTLDHRLRVEISFLREMYNNGEISIKWVPSTDQLSDIFTKQGASYKSLIDVLKKGHSHSTV